MAHHTERDVSLRFTQLDDLRSHLPKSDDRLLAGSTREYQIRPYGVAVHCAARRGGLPSAESKPKKRLTGAEYSSVWRPYLVGMDSAPHMAYSESDQTRHPIAGEDLGLPTACPAGMLPLGA